MGGVVCKSMWMWLSGSQLRRHVEFEEDQMVGVDTARVQFSNASSDSLQRRVAGCALILHQQSRVGDCWHGNGFFQGLTGAKVALQTSSREPRRWDYGT